MLMNMIQLSHNVGKHGHFRPSWLTRPTINPRAWLHYAVNAVLAQIREKAFTPEKFELRRINKQKYIELYKDKVIKDYEMQVNKQIKFEKNPEFGQLNVTDLEELLLEIEDQHSVEEIYLFRSIAEKQLNQSKS